jgi:endonuclease YncB( thermonuclease family)
MAILNVKINNRKEKIRLACVDAMESKQEGGKEATNFLSRLVPVGSKITIVDVGRDRDQRILGSYLMEKPMLI